VRLGSLQRTAAVVACEQPLRLLNRCSGQGCHRVTSTVASRLLFLLCFFLQKRIHRSPHKFGGRRPGFLTDVFQSLHLVRSQVDVRARLHCAAKYTPLWQHRSRGDVAMSVKGDGLDRNSHLKPPVLTSTWYGCALGGERSGIAETIFLN
jgi:hypothetical protein